MEKDDFAYIWKINTFYTDINFGAQQRSQQKYMGL